MKSSEINPNEWASYMGRYVAKVNPDLELLDALEEGKTAFVDFYGKIPAEKHHHRYDAGKWSLKEVLQHIIDTERIFAYRVLRIARLDKTPLAGFEQDDYIAPSNADGRSWASLIEEFALVRNSSIALIQSLSEANMAHIGEASSFPLSARAVAFMIVGHEIWHREIVKERYL